MVIFPFPFHVFMSLANLGLIRLQGQFSTLMMKSFSHIYLLIRPLRWSLSLGRRIFIQGFIRFPPALAVYDVYDGIGRDFPFSENETRRHFSYLSVTLRNLFIILLNNSRISKNNAGDICLPTQGLLVFVVILPQTIFLAYNLSSKDN